MKLMEKKKKKFSKKISLEFVFFDRIELIERKELFSSITIECGVPIRLFIIINEEHIE